MADTTEALKTLDTALSVLLDRYASEPKASDLNQGTIKAFEELTNRIPLITAGMIKTAALANAASLVGSTHIIDYLVKDLGLSQAEAWTRARRAEEFFGDVLPRVKTPPERETGRGRSQFPRPRRNVEREKPGSLMSAVDGVTRPVNGNWPPRRSTSSTRNLST